MSSSLLAETLQALIAAKDRPLSFAEFMQVALYHPEIGYYSKPKERIGFSRSTDFFTASSTGNVFGELVVEACTSLLAPADPADFCFIEFGAEPDGGILPPAHPFQDARIIRREDSWTLPEKAVIFSNELFDAQPFHRLLFSKGEWREVGVTWREGPTEIWLPEYSPPVEKIADRLPETALEGYRLDLPLAAADLLEEMVATSQWNGLFVAFDYGKSWRELIEATPQGTARAYRHHRQSNDLLADPGQQDLTCHVCWDWLEERLGAHDFREATLQSQEAFFVTHAIQAIQTLVSTRPGAFDPRRHALQQLLHPGNMGQKFQVLHARRGLD